MPQDSITHAEQPVEVVTARGGDSIVHSGKPRTPYQVLRSLPPNATPAQQDSAIQATFQPAEIRYSNQPDTLHLPGHDKGVKLTDVDIPIYYEKTFFAQSLQQAGKISTIYGMPGDPVPYTLHNDHVMTSVLLGTIVLTMILLANIRNFVIHQVKTFFYIPRTDHTFMPETSGEIRCQYYFVFQTSLLLSVLQYFFTQQFIGTTFILRSDYMLIGIYLGLILAYFALHALLYTFVNLVFFDARRNFQWMKILLFITSFEGIALFPLILLLVYFDLSTESVILGFAIILILTKLLTFYKCFVIFFRQFGGFLQIILYFCALEIVPLAAIGIALVLTGNMLKINY